MKKRVLFLENLPYRAHITVGSHHYARLFAQDHDVLWISLPWHPLQLVKDRKSDRVRNWNWNRPVQVSESLSAMTPFILLPYRNHRILRSSWYLEHLYSFMPAVVRTIERLGFSAPDVVWFTDPRHLSILDHVRPGRICYRCVDDLEQFSDVPATLIAYERALIRRADAVFFTSRQLMRKFEGLSSRVHHLPNACDFERFSDPQAGREYDQVATQFFRRGKRNVVYTGAIAEWFDFDAVEAVAEVNDAHVVVVGPLRTTVPPSMKRRDNVVFTGPFPFEAMPAFLRQADVALLPFNVSPLTDAVDPIKLHEYCAAGLPVVTSAFRTVVELGGPYSIYRSRAEIPALISAACALRGDASARGRFVEFARANCWRARYERVLAVIGERN